MQIPDPFDPRQELPDNKIPNLAELPAEIQPEPQVTQHQRLEINVVLELRGRDPTVPWGEHKDDDIETTAEAGEGQVGSAAGAGGQGRVGGIGKEKGTGWGDA